MVFRGFRGTTTKRYHETKRRLTSTQPSAVPRHRTCVGERSAVPQAYHDLLGCPVPSPLQTPRPRPRPVPCAATAPYNDFRPAYGQKSTAAARLRVPGRAGGYRATVAPKLALESTPSCGRGARAGPYQIPSCTTYRCANRARTPSAMLLLSPGVNPRVVQEQLGHTRIRATTDTYPHVLLGMQRIMQ
jgi:hypothetical protein